MKRLAGFSALALIISSTSGCGWIWGPDGYFRDRGSDYLDATQVAPMQLPPDITGAKRLDPLLPIPRNVANNTTKGQYIVPRPQQLAVTATASDFSLQKTGDSRSILAQRSPAEVWPIAHQYFEDNGFRIGDERPQTGEFNTSWQRIDELSSAMAKRLTGSGASADTETRVRVRIEPGVQRNTSEIYVVSITRPAGSKTDGDFPANTANLGLDSALTDDLLASMSRSAEKGGSVSLLAARDFDTPKRVALIVDGSGNPVLNVADDLDRAWSSVGRALDQGDWRVEDINRSLGLYYINLAEKAKKPGNEPGFFSRLFSSTPDKEQIEARAERYQVRLSKVGDNVQVTVEKNINTVAPPDVARRVLGIIQDNLG
ncbi:outer membrane protein assembly factor BamC [Pseudomonas sp. 10B1]|uniref:outer membrane protein assembly factor BamC n=1 Tax=unclassified Pseudomonas TaxID=196821 RepID=UPI002AB5ACBE|nr:MULTISPECIES: outer membrane protein assembly factor BamC [unclassified Pseudomonas]MDY7561243.1 outer membrane protein assembly factor BamC [Pseudomonas sp. AB6]MEA9976985.1 outer membrane protein assembly factor BamC [Pseudomonas sp. RTS4]MEA9995946.1 outer membrane protein assembly factor BamC [Pseudomonas sp. AA4]MEB0087672.1 outer membrane protein assembly factor BamC [Pseudomonas sp. RTI1]MEB0127747.1 outer membrane protein assembly factor BamC [Pseudomonas sp. CCC1.2]